MISLSRRRFLLASAGAAAAGLSTWPTATPRAAAPVSLSTVTRTIEVDGKAAKVLGIMQPDGMPGLVSEAGQRFQVTLSNRLDAPTLVHWHGLAPPSGQDGVPDISQPALPAGKEYAYDFPLARPGTYWMHSHLGFQEQQLLAAPLIIRDPAEAGVDEQEVVVLLHDFNFRDPMEVFAELTKGSMAGMSMSGMAGMDHSKMASGGSGDSGMSGGSSMSGSGDSTSMASMGDMGQDINDVSFDAFLANDRTLADPEVVRVEAGGRVRLRIINAGAATNFFLDLGALDGDLMAVDGQPIQALTGRRFELAMAQRLDIRLALPKGEGAYPVLAVREGDVPQTGIVLATAGARIERIPDRAEKPAGIVGLDLERRLVAAQPLAGRAADRTHAVDLTGSMASYVWTLNGRKFGEDSPLAVKAGERVEIVMRNLTGMSHPMHLHGHLFQVVAIDGERFAGAARDTVLVPPKRLVTIAFDAGNPGRWAFHCHNLYHMEAGMMTTVRYEA